MTRRDAARNCATDGATHGAIDSARDGAEKGRALPSCEIVTRSEVRWLVAIPTEDGSLEAFRVEPLGAALEFRAPDRPTAERALVASGCVLPVGARLTSLVEFEAIRLMPKPRPKPSRRRRESSTTT